MCFQPEVIEKDVDLLHHEIDHKSDGRVEADFLIALNFYSRSIYSITLAIYHACSSRLRIVQQTSTF